MMIDERFGPCVVFLPQPGAAHRFYGPFRSEDEACDWIRQQIEQTHNKFVIVPLRRTDIKRTHDQFYNPAHDFDVNDFWDDGMDSIIKRIGHGYSRDIAVGPGWSRIIKDCNRDLAEIDPDYAVYQIKEKFGGLRYYYSPSEGATEEMRKKMDSIVSRYEALAANTCEETGERGFLMRNKYGYYRTLSLAYATTVAVDDKYTLVSHYEFGGDRISE